MQETQIDSYVFDHLGEESDVLKEVYRYTNLHVLYPGMVSGHEQGRLLSMISRMVKPDRILEIGTFTGYSAICLAEGLSSGGCLYTIEQNDEVAGVAMDFFKKADLEKKIKMYVGNALDIIEKFDFFFDLIFIDGAKKQYLEYYCAIFDKVKPGGFILIDNILWYTKVTDCRHQDETTNKLREFNDFVKNDIRVEKAIVKNRDGLFILWKKE
jgi:predicted O-methyltransferase YrrM